MRIAHVITRLVLGGAQENTLYNVEDLVHRHGQDVLLLSGPATGPEGDLFARAHRNQIPVATIPTLQRAIHPRADYQAYRDIYRELKRYRPDVVHTHSSKAGILGRLAAWQLRVPAIIHTIHGLPFGDFESWWKNQFYQLLERQAAQWCHRIISVADAMTAEAVAAKVASPKKFVTIYSGMEVETFLHPPRSRAAVRAEWNLQPDDLVVGKVARLFELKGHDDVIDAAQELIPQFPRLRFLFVGGGLWHDRLWQRIEAAGLTDHFRFTGLVPSSQIPELLAAMDLLVHASYREGLARVLPQALIAGKAVVSYDVGGAREVILPGITGELFPVGDRPGLTAALAKLLRDPQLRDQYGHAGRHRFADQFRHEVMTAQILQVYDQVLAEQRMGTSRR